MSFVWWFYVLPYTKHLMQCHCSHTKLKKTIKIILHVYTTLEDPLKQLGDLIIPPVNNKIVNKALCLIFVMTWYLFIIKMKNVTFVTQVF